MSDKKYFNYSQIRLAYREHGEGPLLVVLPGNTASSDCHDGELEYFSGSGSTPPTRRYHVASLDYAGTGGSDRLDPWPDLWWEFCAQQVAALIDHLGERNAILMGTSGGAGVALLTAIYFPDKIRAVVADSEVASYPPGHLEFLVKDREQRTPGQVAFWSHAHGRDWSQVVDADSAMLLRFASQGGDVFQDLLKEIHCPVLLTASLSDELLPDIALQLPNMARQIQDSRLYLTKKGCHPFMWSSPNEFRRIAALFLEDVSLNPESPSS